MYSRLAVDTFVNKLVTDFYLIFYGKQKKIGKIFNIEKKTTETV